MTLSQIKFSVMDAVTARLRFSYGISDFQAARTAELMVKMMYSKIAAVQLGNALRGMSQELQNDFEGFVAGDNYNPYSEAVIAAMNIMGQYGVSSGKDIKAMMKAS